jgi:hypothetical protein
MRNVFDMLVRAFLAAVVLLPVFASAHTLTLSPASTTVVAGGGFSLQLLASDLDGDSPGDIVTSFDVDVGFDPSVVSAISVNFNTAYFDPLFSGFDAGTGTIDLFGLSIHSDDALRALQGGGPSLLLATISFKAVAPGHSLLALSTQELTGGLDGQGNATVEQGVNDIDAQVTVTGSGNQVPTPGTVSLIGIALLALWWMAQRRIHVRRSGVRQQSR